MKTFARAAVPILGGIASLVAICWIVYLAWQRRDGIAELDFPFATIVVYAFLYAFSLLLLAWNWAEIVWLHDDSREAAKTLLWATFLKSQAWKYLPGNVFHYVGRHVAGRSGGASSAALLKATVTESAALVAAALAVAAFGLLMSDLEALDPVRAYLLWPVALAGLLCLGSLLTLTVPTWRRHVVGRWLFVLVRAAVFMTCLGILTCFILGDFVNAGAIIGATALAWVLGFLTPGSPGGLGTREAALLILLAPVLGETEVLGACFVLRAITMGGDFLVSMLGIFSERFYQKKKSG